MSKKHYEKIARALHLYKGGSWSHLNIRKNNPNTSYLDLIDRLCVIFEEDNDRFNSDKFREACGIIEVHHG